MITKGLVAALGGTMEVTSQPDEGSVFSVLMPRAFSGGAQRSAALPSAANITQDKSGTGRHRVLYVEDNLANLKMVQLLLKRRPDIELFSATDGASGIALAQSVRPEVILLDVHLPDMDGFAVLQRLRALPETADAVVLAVSANAMPADVEKGVAAGFRRYLTKPIKVDEFLAVLDEVLQMVETME